VELFFQQFINGLVVGSVYSLVALGLTLVYGTMQIPNFAHGHLYMIGAYITFFLTSVYGVSYWPAIVGSAIVVAAVGAVLERLVFHPLRNAPPVNAMIAALGVMLFLEAIAKALWGADFRRMETPYSNQVLHLFGLNVTMQRILVIIGAVLIMVVLYWFLKKTVIGSAIEAVAQDRDGALLVGIDTSKITLLTFALSSAIAAIAASLIAPINLIFPAMGMMVILKAFAITVLGGMGSVPGAIVGGYILALAESFGGTYISSDYNDVIAFALLVIILAIRPTGLFSKGG
jgi:branched-chain amino acid transport system permease protein